MKLSANVVQSRTQDLNEAESQTHLYFFNMLATYPTTAIAWSANACDSVNRHQYLHIGPWRNCSRGSLGGFSAVAYHFGKKLADSLQVPVGIICNAVGGTTTESWIDRHTLEQRIPAILHDWCYGDSGVKWTREQALQNISVGKNPLQRHPYAPTYMFETGMLSLKGYSIKGIVWYQGESNAHSTELHERLFPMLQKSWRNFFHDSELPFYFVQLSSLNRPSWPRFRDSQRRITSRLRNTWVAVTTDVGDFSDVHYTNKKPVGERPGLQALHHSYDYNIESDGPVCHSVSAKDNGIELQSIHAKSLSAKGSRLVGFEVVGADGIYYPAETQIASSNTIPVRSSFVTRPLYVRYGWQPFTRVNLVNEVGLPRSTFQRVVRK